MVERGEDLGAYGSPIGAFLGANDTAVEALQLPPEAIEQFVEEGVTSGHPVLSGAQCDALIAELEQLRDPDHPGHRHLYEWHADEAEHPDEVLFHALGAWRLGPAFHDVVFHPAVGVAAWQLLGGPVRFLHDQIFAKPAGHGGRVSWHQDYSYWQWTAPMAHLTCYPASPCFLQTAHGVGYRFDPAGTSS